ncbi:MAG: hypothetical protein ACFE8M_00445 [Candidatus Hermodarchaeota archaeon]
MPKFKKEKKRDRSSKAFNEDFAYKTVIKSVILAGFFFVLSILFNMEIITFFVNLGGFWLIINIIIKIVAILLFFFFMLISIGNYKELTGRPLDFKLIVLMFILSLLQAFRDPIVFTFTFFGLAIIIIYMFFIQES